MTAPVSPAAAAPAFPGRRPPWLEFDATDLEFLPAPAQAMIAPVIEPTWHDMVVHARGPVERAVGISMVHLLWIEILIQVGHMDMYRNQDMVLGFPLDPSAISQTLKLIGAKAKLVNACLRLEEFRLKNGRGAFEPDGGAAVAPNVGRTILSVPKCAAEGDGQDCPSYGGDALGAGLRTRESPLPGDLRSSRSAGSETCAEPGFGDGQDSPSYGGARRAEEAPAFAERKATLAERKNGVGGEQTGPCGQRARSAQRRLRRALAKGGKAGKERAGVERTATAPPAHEGAPNGPCGTQQEIVAPAVVAILERLEALAAGARPARADPHVAVNNKVPARSANAEAGP